MHVGFVAIIVEVDVGFRSSFVVQFMFAFTGSLFAFVTTCFCDPLDFRNSCLVVDVMLAIV